MTVINITTKTKTFENVELFTRAMLDEVMASLQKDSKYYTSKHFFTMNQRETDVLKARETMVNYQIEQVQSMINKDIVKTCYLINKDIVESGYRIVKDVVVTKSENQIMLDQLNKLKELNDSIQQTHEIGTRDWHWFETLDDMIFAKVCKLEAEIESN